MKKKNYLPADVTFANPPSTSTQISGMVNAGTNPTVSPVYEVPIHVNPVDFSALITRLEDRVPANPVGVSFAYQVPTNQSSSYCLSDTIPQAVCFAVSTGYDPARGLVPVYTSVIPVEDLRRAVLGPRVKAVLQAAGVAVHDVRHLVHVPSLLDLVDPSSVYCTRLAALMRDLGKYHVEARSSNDVEDILHHRADRRREVEASLGGLRARYHLKLQVPSPVDMSGMLTDHAFVLPTVLNRYQVAVDLSQRAAATGLSWPFLRRDLIAEGLLDSYLRIQMPAAFTLARMEREGIRIDVPLVRRAIAACEDEVALLGSELSRYGITRPLDDGVVLPVLRDQGVIPSYPFRTGKGWERLGLRDLEMMKKRDRSLDLLYRYRLAYRMGRGALGQCLQVDRQGRVHPVMDPLGADTGRISFSRPNLPGLARVFRPVVRPDTEDHVLIEFDYKQQEIGVMAALYQDPQLLADFNAADVYVIVATEFLARALGVQDTAMLPGSKLDVPTLREWSKVILLGFVYGLTPWGISLRLGVSEGEAERLLDGLKARYPTLVRNMELQRLRVAQSGYATSVTGLRRHRPTAGSTDAREGRWAVNSPVQSSGADLLKLLLPRLETLLAEVGGRIVLPPHDSVVVQLPKPLDPEAVLRVHDRMVTVFRELFPTLRPRVDINADAPWCWNKNGRADSVEQFIARVRGDAADPQEK